jgi:hypothetical protein
MMTPSFERFDYQLRSNKNIERKLVFDLLLTGRQRFNFRTYRYMGLGSMWFADHRLAHRMLGIDNLVSIERAIHAGRAEFNKPYLSVGILPGDVSEVIPKQGKEYWQTPTIVWLDYDGLLQTEVALALEQLLGLLAANSVVIVTVNAVRRAYVRKGRADERTVATITDILGDVIPASSKPTPTPGGANRDISEKDFPSVLARSLLAFLDHKTRTSGRTDAGANFRFVPLYNLGHKDGADMITVGGALATASTEADWRDLLIKDRVLPNHNADPTYCCLDMVPLTLKEKITLDELLPQANGGALLAQAELKGLKLDHDQIAKYERYYRHFPMFLETPF